MVRDCDRFGSSCRSSSGRDLRGQILQPARSGAVAGVVSLSRLSATASTDLALFLRGFGIFLFLTGLQLSAPEVGRDPGFAASLFFGNLVASAPWLPLGLLVVTLTRWRSPLDRRGSTIHLAVSALTAVVFLAWLAAFHRGVGLLRGNDPTRTWVEWFRADLAEYFVVAVSIYWLVVAATLVGRGEAARPPLPDRGEGARASSRRSSEAALVARPDSGADEGAPDETVVDAGVDSGPIPISSAGRIRWVDPASVTWIEASGSYVRLHTGSGSRLLRRSLSALTEELSSLDFVRIHRSRSVRLDQVVELRRRSHGDAVVVLRDGTELAVSRTFRSELTRRLPSG